MTRQKANKAGKVLSFFCVVSLLGGCGVSQMTGSLGDGVFSSPKQAENAAWKPIITEESMLTAARTGAGPVDMASVAGCPQLQVEGGQRYVTYYEGNRVGDSSAVIHRGEITKTARECQVENGQILVKYGIAGRVLLGPKGKPGTITLPATMQINDKAKAKVKSEPIIVNVTISKENPLSYFSIVRDVTIPVKQGATPQEYSIVISFDKNKPGAS